MKSDLNMKQVIYYCIENILIREQKNYAKLREIYNEVSTYLEIENSTVLQSQIRGRLQENCSQYNSYTGEDLFVTEKVRSGNWGIRNRKKYIRHTHNSYLITCDNWLTLEKVITINEDYKLEENLDNVYRAKLIDAIGSLKANIIINELIYIKYLLKKLKHIDKENIGYGLAFEVLAVSVIHNIDYEECINQYIIHGDGDGKIDAIYYGDSENIYIYQIKIGEFDNDYYDKMKTNYDKCLRGEQPKDGKDLFEFVNKNNTLLRGKKVWYRSVSANSKRSTNYQTNTIYQLFFENKLLPLKNNHIMLTILKPTISGEEFNYNVSTDGNNNFSFYLSADKLISYLLKSLGINFKEYDKEKVDISKYFSDNVRGTLSVNKKMICTIEEEPENFIKYNNGISITGEVHDLGTEILIKNPVINNGQQTITTLLRYGKNLNRIVLCIKITNENNMTIKGKISQFTNDQVKVKAIDMLSLNPYIREIQEIIFQNEFKGEQYFLEIYSSGKKNYYSILNKLYHKNHIIELLDFIKLYFSVQNKKELGNWKNSPNNQIDKLRINETFDKNLSFKVCQTISKFEQYIDNISNKKEKDDLKSADLAFKYLLCKENLEVEVAATVIHMINENYFYNIKNEKSKLIDIYKSSTIINKIEEQLKIYKENLSLVKE